MLLTPQVHDKCVVPGIRFGGEAGGSAGELADCGLGFGREEGGAEGVSGVGGHVDAGAGPGGFLGREDAQAGENGGDE